MTDRRYMKPGLPFATGKAVEEAGEFLQALGKTLRFEWESYNPETKGEANCQWVQREMKDLRDALDNLEVEMRAAGLWDEDC